MINDLLISKFRRLPLEIYNKISSLEVVDLLKQIEEQYPQQKVSLAEIVIRIAVRDIALDNLAEILEKDYGLDKEIAERISAQLKEKIDWSFLEVGVADEFQGIKEEGKRLKTSTVAPTIMPFEKVLEECFNLIKEATGFESTNELLKTRFRNIIISFLKEVRDEKDTRLVLKRPQKIGGMELDEPTIDQIIKILKEEKAKIKPEIPPKKEEKKPDLAQGIATPTEIIKGETPVLMSEEGAPPVEAIQKFELGTITPPVKELPAVKPAEKKERLIRPVALPFEEVPLEEVPSQQEPPKEETVPIVEARKTAPSALEELDKEWALPSEPTITVRRPPSTSRPVVEEVKVRPKVYGPIDELRNLRLADWKRLGGGKETAERIFDKISLLGEDSLTKKAQGIRAWKESEVHLLYLEIGTEAVDKGKTVEEIIRERQQEGRPTLTMEDFDAIGELNQKFRF